MKRLISILLTAFILLALIPFSSLNVSAAMLTYQSGFDVTSDGAVTYKKYSAAGAHTEDATVLQFNPKDGYIPMAFASAPTYVATLDSQYNTAVNTYGYEVAGVINGGYFTTATSTLEGMVITDGKIIAATNTSYSLTVFGSDGSVNFVTSTPKYVVSIKDVKYENPIYYFNKDYADADSTYTSSSMFYYDYYSNASTNYSDSGVEVVFEKQDNTELSYGRTLIGKVVKVNSSTKGGTTFSKNQFALFAKSGSTYASKLSALSVGEKVTIGVTETNASSKSIMEDANSALNNIGYLVQNGEVTSASSVGGHSVTGTYARWTAFGIKADGTYVFFTSEGGSTGNFFRSLTLKDVANALVELGCVTAVRFDGGGSTSMYVSNTGSGSAGFVMSGQRAVADTLLVVKKSSLHDAELEEQLQNAITSAKQVAGNNSEILNRIAQAEALIGKGATEGELNKAISDLSLRTILGDALAECENVIIGEYTEPELSELRSAYKTAKSVYNSDTATDSDYTAQITAIYDILNNSTNINLSKGASYTTTAPNRGDGDTHNDDQVRLTDGYKGCTSIPQKNYSGWTVSQLTDGIVNVDIDLGSVQTSNTYKVYFASGQWGIQVPNATVNVYTSTDGVNYNNLVASTDIEVSTGSYAQGTETCTTYIMTATSDSDVSARYVRVSIKNISNFTWIDEVEVWNSKASKYNTVSDYIEIKSFNTIITAGSSTIFTPEMGTLTDANANHDISANVICEKQSDGSYVVVENVSYHGDSSRPIILNSNQIMISAYGNYSVQGSDANASRLASAEVGQVVWFYGIDVENEDIGVAAYVKFLDAGQTNPDLAENTLLKIESYTYDSDAKWWPTWVTNVSSGVSYDDYIRLTDGIKNAVSGWDDADKMSAWYLPTDDTDIEFILKLDELSYITSVVANVVEYSTYGTPDGFSISYSKDGTTYIPFDKEFTTETVVEMGVQNSVFAAHDLKIELDTCIIAQYIKINFAVPNRMLILEEFEVCGAVGDAVDEHGAASDKWVSSENGHWHECICGGKIDFASHDDGKWIVIEEAGIDKEGEKELRCTVCGYVLATETIPAEHSYSEDWKSDKDNHWHECDCGDKTDVNSHDDGKWVVTEEAGIDKEGEKELRCTVCGYILDTETIPAEHSYSEDWKSDKDTHWHECGCGDKADVNAHDSGKWITTEEAGIDKEGKKELQCTVCGYVLDTDIIPMEHAPETDVWFTNESEHWQECACGEKLNSASHDDGKWVITEESDLDKDGKRELRCTTCGYVLATEIIPAGHKYSEDWTSDKDNHWHECSCGDKLDIASHDNGKWVVIEDAGIDKEGKKELRCTVCGYVLDTETIPAEHSYSEDWKSDKDSHWHECGCGDKADVNSHDSGKWVVTEKADIDKEGEKELQCTVCGYVLDKEIIPAIKNEEDTPTEEDKPSTDNPTEDKPSTDKPVEDEPTDEPTDKPDNNPSDKPVDKPTDEPTEKPDVPPVDEEPEDIMLGDVNGNGEIDSMDYILLKRAYFGTFNLDEDATKRADLTKNGEIDSMDYILLKRAYFGTYTIK